MVARALDPTNAIVHLVTQGLHASNSESSLSKFHKEIISVLSVMLLMSFPVWQDMHNETFPRAFPEEPPQTSHNRGALQLRNLGMEDMYSNQVDQSSPMHKTSMEGFQAENIYTFISLFL